MGHLEGDNSSWSAPGCGTLGQNIARVLPLPAKVLWAPARPALPHSQEVWVHSQPCPTGRAHQRKLVGDLAVRWDFGTKAVGREELVAVVVLDDFPHCLQCQGIGAQLVRAHVVQRGGL